MIDEPSQPAEHVEPHKPSGDVTGNVACRSCGYNLRGVARDGFCPECGTSVEWSLRGFQLRFADRRWLERLHIGSTWVYLSMGVLFLGGGILFLVGLASRDLFGGDTPNVLGAIAFLWLLIFLVTYAISAWYLTSPEPRVKEITKVGFVRRFARYVTVLGTAGLLIVLVELKLETSLMNDMLHVFSYVFTITSHLALIQWLRNLALRAPSQTDPAACRMYQGAIAIVAAIICTLSFGKSPSDAIIPDPACCMIVLLLGSAVVFGAWFFGIVAGVRLWIERALNHDQGPDGTPQ